MSFFVSETGETECGLSSSTVFFGEVDGEFVDYFTGVAGESTKETAVTIHDDEAETGVVFEEGVECFGVEFVVAEVEGRIDGFEGFEINIEFSFFSFVCDDVSKYIQLESASKVRSRLETYPQNTTSPLGGTRLYNFNLCWVDVMAPKTESLLTRDLMFDAVPYSSASSFCTRGIWSLGGMMREIILVPFLNKC